MVEPRRADRDRRSDSFTVPRGPVSAGGITVAIAGVIGVSDQRETGDVTGNLRREFEEAGVGDALGVTFGHGEIGLDGVSGGVGG